jgi:hypothetical protein
MGAPKEVNKEMNEFKKIESRNVKWWTINGTIKKKDLKLFSISSTSSSPTFLTISIFQPFEIVQLILFHPLSNFPKVPKHFTQVGMQQQ